MEGKREKEHKAQGVGGAEGREGSQRKNIYLDPILPRQNCRFALASSSLAVQLVRSTMKYKYEKIEVCEKPTLSLCKSRLFSHLGQEAARLNTSPRKYQQTLPSILGFFWTGGSRFIKASKSIFMFSTTTFNSSTLSLVLSMNKI